MKFIRMTSVNYGKILDEEIKYYDDRVKHPVKHKIIDFLIKVLEKLRYSS